MSTFMNTDPKAFSGVWVFCEQRQGKMMPTTFELISEGRKLADELGVQLSGILLGDSVDNIAAELGGYGADKVYVYNSPLLKDYTTDAYTKIITDAVHEPYRPRPGAPLRRPSPHRPVRRLHPSGRGPERLHQLPPHRVLSGRGRHELRDEAL